MAAIFKTTQTLWYNNGIWGKLGYAVPNFGLGAKTMNATIKYLVSTIGRNLSGVVHDPDADVRTPPTINTISEICKLINRARSILAARALQPGTAAIQVAHVQPGLMDQLVYPVPYFLMANQWIQEYTGLILAALAEAMQHSENRQPFAITTNFANDISQLLQQVYMRVAIELLAVDPVIASDKSFVVTADMLKAYNPAAYFTSTEMIDVTTPTAPVPTGMDLTVLTNGIPASQLVGLATWPDGTPYDPAAPSSVTVMGTTTAPAASAAPSANVASIPPFTANPAAAT